MRQQGELLYSMAMHHEHRIRQRAYEIEEAAIVATRLWAERKLAEEFPDGAPERAVEPKRYKRYHHLLYAQRHPDRVHAVKKRSRQKWAAKNAETVKDYQHDYKKKRHADTGNWGAPKYRERGHPDHEEWKQHNAAYQYKKKFLDRKSHACAECEVNDTFATICKSCAAKRSNAARQLLRQLKPLEDAAIRQARRTLAKVKQYTAHYTTTTQQQEENR